MECIKCGATHQMVISNRITGEITPLDKCEDCIFEGCHIKHPKEKIVIDGKIANRYADLPSRGN